MKEPLRVPFEAAEPDLAGPRLVHEKGGDDGDALPSFCAELREARQRGGYSLSDAAHVLRIQEHYLEALEEGRFDRIPGTTYAIGFLRSYSGFLGLDPDEIIDAFKREQGLDKNEQRLAFPSPSDTSPKPKFWLILLVLVLAGLAYGGWQYQSTGGQIATDLVDDVSTKLTEAVGLNETDATAGGAAPETAAATAVTEPATEPAAEAAVETTVATAAAPIVEEATTTPVPESAPASEEAASVPAAPVQEEPAQATAEPTDVAAVDLIPAAEVWDESGAEVAALEASPAEETPAPPPPARIEAAVEAAPATPAPSEPVQAADATAPPEPSAALLTTTDLDSVIAAPLELAVTVAVGGGTSDPGAAAEESAAGDSARPAASTESTEIASTDAASARSEAAEAVTSEPAPPEPMVDSAPEQSASLTAPTQEEPPLSVATTYVPKVYGRSNLDARVIITAVDDSWVQVQGPDNELLLTRILHAGDTYRVPDRPGLVMVTGNAGGLQVQVDDTPAPALGPLGVVLRNVALDPDRLLAGTAAGG